MKSTRSIVYSLLTAFIGIGVLAQAAVADLNPDMKKKVMENQAKLKEFAAKPELIKALQDANKMSPKMNNKQWKAIPSSDPKVTVYTNSEAGKLLTGLQQSSMGKLFLRDAKGNFIAGSKKPAIYNIKDRPAFTNAIRGKTWASKKVKPDPTTKQASIQISAPVMSGGKVIGVIHANVVQ